MVKVKACGNTFDPRHPDAERYVCRGIHEAPGEAEWRHYQFHDGLILGPPQKCDAGTSEEMAKQGYVGVYRECEDGDMDVLLGNTYERYHAPPEKLEYDYWNRRCNPHYGKKLEDFELGQVFGGGVEENPCVDHSAVTAALQAKYGKDFEPDFTDSNVIGRWKAKPEDKIKHRRRWVGGKYVWEKYTVE